MTCSTSGRKDLQKHLKSVLSQPLPLDPAFASSRHVAISLRSASFPRPLLPPSLPLYTTLPQRMNSPMQQHQISLTLSGQSV